MKIAILDDDEYQLNILKEALYDSLEELHLQAQVDAYPTPEAFLAVFRRGKYDVAVLDIYMGEMNGIEVARRIRQQDTDVALAFCTSSNEFASETYEVMAKYYLNKPISKDKVKTMLTRLNLSDMENRKTVPLPDGFSVPLRKIMYTEYNNHTVTFHIKDIPPRSFYMTQGEAESLLLEHRGFCVVNKGCIANMANVTSVAVNSFKMQNGETLQVARRRFKELEAAYTRYVFEKMVQEVGE